MDSEPIDKPENQEDASPRARGLQAYVYVIAIEASGPVKIGWTVDPLARLAGLQTGSPYRLRIFAAFELPSKSHAKRIEGASHFTLSGNRGIGEWFAMTANDARVAVARVISEHNYPLSPWRPSHAQIRMRAKQLKCEADQITVPLTAPRVVQPIPARQIPRAPAQKGPPEKPPLSAGQMNKPTPPRHAPKKKKYHADSWNKLAQRLKMRRR